MDNIALKNISQQYFNKSVMIQVAHHSALFRRGFNAVLTGQIKATVNDNFGFGIKAVIVEVNGEDMEVPGKDIVKVIKTRHDQFN